MESRKTAAPHAMENGEPVADALQAPDNVAQFPLPPRYFGWGLAWWQDATATGCAWQGGRMPPPRVGLAPVVT